MAKKTKALLLFSGGLDSILAAKILERQGIQVTALTFESYFFDAKQARKSAKENRIKIITADFSDNHFDVVKNPKFGRGVGMNPCIDCHLFMIKAARKILKEKKFDFLATGEVLGQRPLSQNRRALELIEKEAGLQRKILRPLSARVLPETEMEKLGLVDCEKLLGISGRSRKEQLLLAKKFGVKFFPTPAGGCILTDKEYSKKLEDLIDRTKKIKASDVALLRLGRHFWTSPVRSNLNKNNRLDKTNYEKILASNGVKTKIILGRNHEENLALKKMADKGDLLIDPKNIPGPTALVRGKVDKKNINYVINYVTKLLQKYSKKAEGDFEIEIRKI